MYTYPTFSLHTFPSSPLLISYFLPPPPLLFHLRLEPSGQKMVQTGVVGRIIEGPNSYQKIGLQDKPR